MSGVARRCNGRWQARWRDPEGRQRSRDFKKKSEATGFLATVDADLVRGQYTDPTQRRMRLAEWCDRWLEGYSTRRDSTVRQARVHLLRICGSMGRMPLDAIRPSDVRNFVAELQRDGLSESYVYALYRRLSQVLGDAVNDGILTRNPCTRATAPRAGHQRPYVATTEQVWQLHDLVPEHLQPAILLGGFAGLRISEVSGLRAQDVDFLRRTVTPQAQYGGGPLKSPASHASVPVPEELVIMLSQSIQRSREGTVICDELGFPVPPWSIERAVRRARGAVAGLHEAFRFQDLRHYYASLLISEGLDIKVVQARLRHASATTTLNVYGHLWPDRDETSRAAVGRAMAAREASSCAQDVHKSIS
jgi:integrase